jgi:predicted ATPase
MQPASCAFLIRDADELPTPDSVHAVLAGRLDRLPLAERRMVRIASVFGADFRRSVLEAVWDGTDAFDATLEAIRGSGMIQKATLLPEPLFRFRHALIRDVAYAGLLEHQRRDLHRRVGEALEASTRGADWAAHSPRTSRTRSSGRRRSVTPVKRARPQPR